MALQRDLTSITICPLTTADGLTEVEGTSDVSGTRRIPLMHDGGLIFGTQFASTPVQLHSSDWACRGFDRPLNRGAQSSGLT